MSSYYQQLEMKSNGSIAGGKMRLCFAATGYLLVHRSAAHCSHSTHPSVPLPLAWSHESRGCYKGVHEGTVIVAYARAIQINTSFIQDTIMMFIGGLTVAIALEKNNLHKRIALAILRVLGTQPKW
jgi:hypothetical protein